MNRLGFGCVVLALFVPVGLRMIAWPSAAATQIEAADVAAGKDLFTHEWTPNDPLTGGDGIGPVFNAKSCVACHNQGGIGGGGGADKNVVTYQAINVPGFGGGARTGILHADATSPEFKETRELFTGGSVVYSQRNTPALFGARLIDEISDREIIAIARKQQLAAAMMSWDTESAPVGRVLFSKDGRAGKFGWKGQTPSLLDFVQGACANELGLSNPNQPQPVSIATPQYQSPGEDLTLKQCEQMAAYIASLPAPGQQLPAEKAEHNNVHRGQKEFNSMGCAVCHVPNVGSAQGIYSDLLLHRMGNALEAEGHYYAPPSDGDPSGTPQRDEWRTPPLWGVADSAPYLHDGRAATLEDAIRQHGGQGAAAALAFDRANQTQRDQVISFLKTLRAPGAN